MFKSISYFIFFFFQGRRKNDPNSKIVPGIEKISTRAFSLPNAFSNSPAIKTKISPIEKVRRNCNLLEFLTVATKTFCFLCF